MAASPTAPSGTSPGGLVGAIILPIAAIVLFLAIWFALPQDNHYLALATIGSVSLLFAIVSYLGRAFVRAGGVLQSLSWGFAGLGFALIVGSLVVGSSVLGTVLALLYLFVVVILVGAWAFLVVWRRGSLAATQRVETRREAWRESAPRSAFEYTTARPNTPPPSPPAGEGSPPAPPPGVSR